MNNGDTMKPPYSTTKLTPHTPKHRSRHSGMVLVRVDQFEQFSSSDMLENEAMVRSCGKRVQERDDGRMRKMLAEI